MNIMGNESYKAKIEYDTEIDMFRGKTLGLNGGADFYGKSPNELRRKFNLRIPPKLHSKIAAIATADDKRINQWVADILNRSVYT